MSPQERCELEVEANRFKLQWAEAFEIEFAAARLPERIRETAWNSCGIAALGRIERAQLEHDAFIFEGVNHCRMFIRAEIQKRRRH